MATGADIIKKHAEFKTEEKTEGGSGEGELDYFLNLLRKETKIKTILEIGFNTGLSTTAFLSARPDITVISIDIGEHNYVLEAKKWIDKEFPNRHLLFIGDSTTTLPQIMKQFPLYKPDFIFIDGGHYNPVPKLDIQNSIDIAHPGTFIVVDDVVPWLQDIIDAINFFMKEHKLHLLDQSEYPPSWRWAVFKKIEQL